MSRRRDCWDNAVAESFFSSLTKARTRWKDCHAVEVAKVDVFDYIEVFYRLKFVTHPPLGQ